MIRINQEPRRGTEPKPILAVLNRSNPASEYASLIKASQRADVPRRIIVANTILDNTTSWRAKTAELGQYAGIWAGGSGDMDHTTNTPELAQFYQRMEPVLAQIGEEGMHVFAECFSHQGIMKIMDAEVVRDRTRWEGGTVPLHLTEDGKSHPLFEGFVDDKNRQKGEIRILSLHKDSVSTLPANPSVKTKVLAWSEGNPAFPDSEGNPYAVVEIEIGRGILYLMQQHTLYTPKNVEPVFHATNKKIREKGILEPFPQTHSFSPIDDTERITVNFLNGCATEDNIFVPVDR